MFGKFCIEIGEQNFFHRKFFVENFWQTKIEKYFSRSKNDQKNFDEKVNENRKFQISEKFPKNFQKFDVFLLNFSTNFFCLENIFPIFMETHLVKPSEQLGSAGSGTCFCFFFEMG